MINRSKRTILIVDDVMINRVLLKSIFDAEYNVIEVENGEQAIFALYEHKDVYAVVLDLVMPIMDGFSVMQAMSNTEGLKDVPIIVVTGSNDEQSQIKALDLGAVDVITKPYSPQIVKARVRNAVERRVAQLRAKETEQIRFNYERQQLELEKSRRDELTGLYSKQYFYSEVRRILEKNPQTDYTIGMFDIDRFKVFNDVFGVSTGDNLLRDIGRMLQTENTRHIIVARLEADHFCALFETEDIDPTLISTTVQTWFDNYPIGFDFSVKMGFYDIDERDTDASVLCDRALLALRSVKNTAIPIGYYDASLRQHLIDEQELLSNINTAFEQEQFHVWFQPQYDYSTGKMCGAEALVRWIHPERGVIPAGKFIHIMERNGSITRLDEYVWEHCCMHLREWLDSLPIGHGDPMPISTNISRADLLRSDLADVFERLTAKYRIPHNLLNLEVTESAYMDDSEQLLNTVSKLRELGFTLEMDDFGAGYSSLNTLKDVPVDILKLDMKFISGSQNSSRGGSILSSVIRMARWLNLPVIAEGVESKEQADFLKSIGCRFMQGFLFAKPMSAQDFEPLYLNANADKITSTLNNTNIKEVEPFLNATSQTALLFNSFLGGAAIFEYHNGNVELLRANDRYFSILNTTRAEYEPWMTHVQDRLQLDSDRKYIVEKLERMTEAGEEFSFESEDKPISGDKPLWIRAQIKLLAKNEVSSIFYLGIDNITERKLAEQELHKQDAMLESLYNAVPSGILRFVVDGGLKLVSYNEAVWKLLHFDSEEEFLNSKAYKKLFSNIYSDDKNVFNNNIQLVLRGDTGNQLDFEHRVLWDDGTVRWVHSTFQNIETETGEKYLQCVFNDITEHREIKTQRYGKSLLKFFDEVIEVDFNRLTYTIINGTNDEVFDVKGMDSLDKLMLGRVNRLVHPDDRGALISIFKQLNNGYKHDVNIPRLDYRIIHEDGTLAGYHSLFLMYVDSGRYLCCISDVTKQKESEIISTENARLAEQLKAKQADTERNRFLLNSFGFTIISYDVGEDVLEYFGQHGGTPISIKVDKYLKGKKQSLLEFVHVDDRKNMDKTLRHAAATYSSGSCDFRQTVDGKFRFYRLNYTSFVDSEGHIYRVFGIATDVQDEYDNRELISELGGAKSGIDAVTRSSAPELLFKILAKTDDAADAINKALAVIGKRLNVSRAYVIENSADKKHFARNFEWCNENIEHTSANSLPYPENLNGLAYEKLFDKEGAFVCEDVNETTPVLREKLINNDIKSFAQWGIWQKGNFVGYVGFDDCSNQRIWSKAHLALLSLVSTYISILLKKLRG